MMEKNVPEIRFSEFEEELKTSLFGNIFDNSIKTNTLARVFLSETDGDVHNVHYGDVLIKFDTLLDVSKVDTPHIIGSKYGDYKSYLHDGDVIFADTAEDETAGKAIEIINVKNKSIVSGLHTIACRPKELFGTGFWGYYLNSPKFHNQIVSLLQGIKVFSINKSKLPSVTVKFPTEFSEQRAIGTIFQSLDGLLVEQKNKLENLQKVKKAMLYKMFPHDGQNIPELRFEGFKGVWREKKLGEISDKVIEKNTSLLVTETLTNSAEFGIISQYDYFDHSITNVNNIGNYYIVSPNDFVYNPRISTKAPVGPIKRNKLGKKGVMSPLYYVFRTHDIDFSFLERFFETSSWHVFMKLNGDSGARSDRFSIKDSVLVQMIILVPELSEQRAIGSYFQTLDVLIQENETKVTHLTHLKQSLLQKMFA